MSIPLLRTKLHIPRLKAGTVTRSRLTQKLTNSSQGTAKLALIVAPAGFGKTTLLSAWHTANPDHPLAWLSLDDDDNDPSRFWSYTAGALETLAPDIPKGSLSRLPVGQVPEETILTHFINELTAVPRVFTYVLDDFHTISNPEILEWLAFVIEHHPPNMHLVLSTRAVPQLPLAQPRAQGRLTEITIQDLRFTSAETATFLRQTIGLQLEQRDIESLTTRTEGWVAGLQLAGLSLQGTGDITAAIGKISGTSRYVADYFIEEVLGRQPPDIEAFLIDTSFLDTFTARLCDTITGRSNSAEIIAMIEKRNLFIVPQDDRHEWYSYHRMFTDLLRARRNERYTKDEIADLHRRAGAWCLENDLVENAISHALLAQDYGNALDLLGGHGYALISSGQARTVERWLDKFPPSHRRTSPELELLAAWSCLASSRFNEVESYLSRIDDHLAAGWLGDDPETRRDTQGQIKAIRATVAMNASNTDLAVPLGQQAQAELHPSNTAIRSVVTLDLADASLGSDDLPEAVRLYRDALYTAQPTGNAIISINAMSKLAHLQFIQGNLHAAAESYHESIQTVQRWGWKDQPVAGLITIGMASLLYEWNTLDQALAYAHASLERLRRWGHPSHIAEALITLAKIEHARGHPDLTEEHLTTAIQHTRRHNLRPTERKVLETRARLALSIGDRALAKSVFDQAKQRFPQPPSKGSLTSLSIVRPLILERRYEDAKAILSEWQDYTESRELVTQRIDVSVLQALNALAQDKRDTALAALQDALIRAEPGVFLRTFLDEGPPMRDLVRLAAERGLEPHHYVSRLLDTFSAGHPVLTDPLSSREDEVLHLIADQLSNQEIADTLFVSVNTVKTHIRRLYSKLSAASRLEAVTRARELGLL